MKKLVLALALGFVLVGSAEASQFSSGLGKTWSYLFSPVNCVANLGAELVASGGRFVVCVLNNINPKNLIP